MSNAKSEAKKELRGLFGIRKAEEHNDLVDRLIDLIIQAAVEEVEYNSQKPQTDAFPCTLYGSSKTEGKI